MFWNSKKRKEIESIKEDTKRGFESVKKDITSVSGWIKHLDSSRESQQKDVKEIKDILSSMQEDLEGVKNVVSVMNDLKPKQVFKTPSRVFNKQTAVQAVQTPVQNTPKSGPKQL